MKGLNLWILGSILFCLFGCDMETYTKPMKYTRNGEQFSCTAFYKYDELIKIVCFSEKRDTILIESFSNNAKYGSSIRKYETGQLRETGDYINNQRVGNWREYYEDGGLMSYRFYNSEIDSIPLYYEKIYKEDGTLDRMMLPIEYRTNSEDGVYMVDQTYGLYIDLLYSEYDSVNSMVLIDPNPASSVKTDTVFYEGRSGYVEFTPKEEGKHSITGIYLEVNGNDPNPDDSKVAEKPFRFEYEAIK